MWGWRVLCLCQVKDLTSPLPPRLALRDMFAAAQAAVQQ